MADWPPITRCTFLRRSFGFLGLFNPMLLLIAAFIFFGAAIEAQQVALREQHAGCQVRDGMRRQFRVVPASGSIRECALDLLESQQNEFPVIRVSMIAGMVRVETVLSAMERGTAKTFAEVMQADVRPIGEYEPLTKTMERATFNQNKTLAVELAHRNPKVRVVDGGRTIYAGETTSRKRPI